VTRFTFVLFTLACAVSLRAHPEIDEALGRLNAQIAAAPANADLYLERGDLYARHDDWIMAEANYLRVEELAPNHPQLPKARGALELATGRAAEARAHLDAALRHDPHDVDALLLRARAHTALKAREAARADFDAALALVARPTPELFLERAALAESPADALRCLDEGIKRLGPVVTLQLRALTLEESLGRTDAAVARLEVLAAQSERKESWLKRRGDLLARAGRAREARAAYAAALAAIDALPAWLQESPEIIRLAHELRQLIASTS
jgi:tetratricopeptide (TPR) repeat protein